MRLANAIFGMVSMLLTQPAFALGYSAACTGVAAEYCQSEFALLNVVTNLAPLFLAVAGGVSVMFVVIGGAMMILNFGDEGMISRGRKAVIYALAGLALTLASQTIASITLNTVLPATGSQPHIDIMKSVTDLVVSAFNIIFVIILVATGFRLAVKAGGSEEFSRAKTTLVWAVAGAIVINVAAALVGAVINFGF